MTDGLRIERIAVEGFKGFTNAQEIDLRTRHVFLIGPNGNGKSSIIEAIRWGLIGSTNRPNDTVKNEGYAGDCRVEIDLARDDKKWSLRRILIPGGGDSRPTLFDEDGVKRNVRDVLPQMDSLDAGEGTHIIFSPQSAPLRRQPEDLTPFERTVFDHLGLKHPRAMLSHLETFLKDQEQAENTLDGLVGEARRSIDRRVANLEDRRGRILASPPWGTGHPPSRQETKRKAQDLIGSIETAEEDVSGFSLGALVEEAELALTKRIGLARKPLDQKLSSSKERLRRLESIQDAHGQLLDQKQSLTVARERLAKALDGASIEELQERVQRERQRAQTRDLKQRLGGIAIELLSRPEETATLCPICGGEREEGELDERLSAMVRVGSEGDGSGLRLVEDQVNTAQQVESDVQELARGIDRLQSEFDAALAAEDDDGLATAVGEGRMSVSEYLKSVTERKASIAKQISDLDDWVAGIRKELRRLREEADFQQILRDLAGLRAIDAEMRRVERAYDQLVAFGESAKDIRDSVKATLMKALREKTPSVAEDLTSVFSALTKHPHFDRLVFDEQKLPSLELCVASSSDSSGRQHPTSVLNGQAQSALALVPYFALSQAAEAPTEVHLVLLDDPTRAFDREHIRILIELLADLGERVQVVVATQETEAFCDLLPRSFKRESYVVVEPKRWSYSGGPELVTQYD